MTSSTTTYWLIAALVCIPALIYFERTEFTTWTSPLLFASFEPSLARHTPRVSEGTFLPPVVTASRTLSPADGPVIITQSTQIPAGVTVTIQPGTQVFFNEFATLNVAGALNAVGSVAQPIYFQTNEVHPSNQAWGGIVFAATGLGHLTHVRLTDASPGITCVDRSRATVRSTTILRGSLGFFNASATCQLFDTTINSSHDGVVLTAAAPDLDPSTSVRAPRSLIARPVAD